MGVERVYFDRILKLEKENQRLQKQWDDFFEPWKDETGEIKPSIIDKIKRNEEIVEKVREIANRTERLTGYNAFDNISKIKELLTEDKQQECPDCTYHRIQGSKLCSACGKELK